MSLINVNGQIDQNAAAQLATQLAQFIQKAPSTIEKTNFIRELAAQLGVSISTQNEDNTDEDSIDYKEKYDCETYDDGHDVIEHRGSLVFINDVEWDEDFACNIFGCSELGQFCSYDFEDMAENREYLDIDDAINNVDKVIEKLKAVKNTFEHCKNDGGKYVIWNNDNDFDYETGDPEDL